MNSLIPGASPGSSGNSAFGGYSSCSTPEVDVVACTPCPQQRVTDDDQKRYFCQRCLNHAQEHPRKGHKPFCQYANCECADCRMVEERRRLNNMLSLRRLDSSNQGSDRSNTGKKIRDPKCALCSAHGNKQPLRGHKKAQCPFLKCGCHLCGLVENRRTLMARQIKLRRDQQKQRKAQLKAATSNNLIQEQSNATTLGSEKFFTSINSLQKKNEPVRVPPYMPVIIKPQIVKPQLPVPVIIQPTPILPTATATTPTPIFVSPVDNIDLHFLPSNYHHQLVNPMPFHFAPVLPCVPTIPFLSAP
ncbi:unnamed protein product [Thelazia callipaeda]|uniref:DM domain-containing protein n=1 Tax=Thelazia callipaeda TaxID=103827 RepID=A0A0N5D896_THECL|nr:unnamed protein product [Thelazia callipaeda]